MRQDKMSMGHGVENRVPFSIGTSIEFPRALPAEHLVRPSLPIGVPGRKSWSRARKAQLRRGVRLPPQVGIQSTAGAVLRSGAFVALMEDRLLPGVAWRGLVDVSVVRRRWRRALSAPQLVGSPPNMNVSRS